MRNIRLKIEYDGTKYSGWQIQNNNKNTVKSPPTIQHSIETTLSNILQENIKIIGSGRTDAGVHALGQVANFKTRSGLSLNAIKRAMNALLPKDILVTKIKEEGPDFHSRFDAVSKTYMYVISDGGNTSVFNKLYEYCIPYTLDVRSMKKGASFLIGKHDFSSFKASDKKERSSTRTIKKLTVSRKRNIIRIEVEADGFLYNMVRNIVGTLVEVGRGKMLPVAVKDILLAKDRKKAGPTAPAKGLCLVRVRYK
jgi:tRNA pseudouridine38-40 synthase